MKQRFLQPREVLRGIRTVGRLYASIPPLLLWRAWEWAAYRHYRLREPVLDLGSGDGRFFHLVWPRIRQVYGIDIAWNMCVQAQQNGIYRGVIHGSALKLPFPENTFASVFSNCAIEHVEDPATVFFEIHRVLRPNGYFLGSVVTAELEAWHMLPTLLDLLGLEQEAQQVWYQYRKYHNYTYFLSTEKWIQLLQQAGFSVLEIIPILPEGVARLFLLLDELWHVPRLRKQTDVGLRIQGYLHPRQKLAITTIQHIVRGLLQLTPPPYRGIGVVLVAKRS